MGIPITRNGSHRTHPLWRKSGWFLLLWTCGVVATLLISSVFKLLILGAVKHL